MTIDSSVAAEDATHHDGANGLAVDREEITKPNGEPGVTEYVRQGTGHGVIIIPMSAGQNRLLVRQYRHAVSAPLWEFPRAIVQANNVAEAERVLTESTGLRGTCRLIGKTAPEASALSTEYAVFEAIIEEDPSTGDLPVLRSSPQSEPRWFSEEKLALLLRDSQLTDALTLASLVLQTVDSANEEF